mgnify:CR=1 FL=1
MTQTRSTEVRGPSRQPCGSCPYRRDVASGIWAASEYAKLTAYDADTPFQPPNLFLCHQTAAEDHRARLCAGWVGCHGPDLLALRLAATTGQLATTDVRALTRTAAGTDRIASCWYDAQSFTVDLNLTDGQAHKVGAIGDGRID